MNCPACGGAMTYLDFLRQREFVRPLTLAQLADLRQNVQTVNCSNCGASVDLASESVCSHCGSALSMLDMNRMHEEVVRLMDADQPRPIDPALPLILLCGEHT